MTANVHIRFIEDAAGDLVDLEHFHHGCAPDDVLGWPNPEATDSPVYCTGCQHRIYEVPLTEEGKAELFANTRRGWVGRATDKRLPTSDRTGGILTQSERAAEYDLHRHYVTDY